MDSLKEHMKKVREDRMAREKARIDKLRELNLKKYNNDNTQGVSKRSAQINSFAKTKSETNVKSSSCINRQKLNTISDQSIGKVALAKSTKYSNIKSKVFENLSKTNTADKLKMDISEASLVNNKVTSKNTKSLSTDVGNLKKGIINKENNNPESVFVKEETDNNMTEKDKKETDHKVLNKKLVVTMTSEPDNLLNRKVMKMKTADRTLNNRNVSLVKNDRTKAIDNKCVTKSNPKTFRKSIAFSTVSSNCQSKSTLGTKVHLGKSNASRKSIAVSSFSSRSSSNATSQSMNKKMSLPSKQPEADSKLKPKRESVFDRLYKSKPFQKKEVDEVKRLRADPDFLKETMKRAELIVNRRYTTFDKNTNIANVPIRRSISAVHFKRMSKCELPNCFHKWTSCEKLNKLNEVNEDDNTKEEKIVSAVKSESKRVKFQTPIFNFNTPKPEELQLKLKNWLQKRGKALDSYHHLQCFGIHHLAQKQLKPLSPPRKFEFYDDENKENIALESDSDNESYEENMNEPKDKLAELKDDKWQRRSCGQLSESVEFDETHETSLSSEGLHHHVDELLLGALSDLTELLKEGFDWEQCARWLRAVRERFPVAPETAAYWECRAALEERRGDLPASVQCWEEAIAKGTKTNVVESNLDNLLDKFMQLKISPNSGKSKQLDSKMVDVKNVFKSTIIRFAVQQAKLRKPGQCDPKYTVTPVRRSSRLSTRCTETRTPLQVVSSIKEAGLLGRTVFVPNKELNESP